MAVGGNGKSTDFGNAKLILQCPMAGLLRCGGGRDCKRGRHGGTNRLKYHNHFCRSVKPTKRRTDESLAITKGVSEDRKRTRMNTRKHCVTRMTSFAREKKTANQKYTIH